MSMKAGDRAVPANKPSRPNSGPPPGPSGHWLMGTMRRWQKDPLGYMEELVQTYGDAVHYRFFLNWHGYLFCHPEHNRHILQDNNHNYTKQPHPSYVMLEPLVGTGLLTNDGEDWLRQRRLIQPVFHRRRIAQFGSIMVDATERMLEKWRRLVGGDALLDVDKEMTRLTLEIVGRSLFGIDLTAEAETVGQAFTSVNRQLSEMSAQPFAMIALRMSFLPAIRRLRANIGALDQVVERVIADRRNGEETRDDLLGMLMAARDADTGEVMNDKQLRDEVMTLLLAGHETTANALSWTFYLLSQYPEAAGRLQKEVQEVLGQRPVTVDDLSDLVYTRMVIEESMRLFPPAWAIGRWAVETDVVGGYSVPANTPVMLSPYMTHRHPAFWPDPTRFDPERFTADVVAERPRYAYIPFGGGPRQCIGNDFALTEARLVLATIAQNYRLKLASNHPVEVEPLITLRPRFGLRMSIQPIRRQAVGPAPITTDYSSS